MSEKGTRRQYWELAAVVVAGVIAFVVIDRLTNENLFARALVMSATGASLAAVGMSRPKE